MAIDSDINSIINDMSDGNYAAITICRAGKNYYSVGNCFNQYFISYFLKFYINAGMIASEFFRLNR